MATRTASTASKRNGMVGIMTDLGGDGAPYAPQFTENHRRGLLGNSDAYSVSSRQFVEDRSLHRIHPWLFHPWLRFRPWVDLGLHPTPQCQP